MVDSVGEAISGATEPAAEGAVDVPVHGVVQGVLDDWVHGAVRNAVEGVNVPRCRSFTSELYRAAGLSASRRAVRKGFAPRSAKNVALGRVLAKAGFWRRLWR